MAVRVFASAVGFAKFVEIDSSKNVTQQRSCPIECEVSRGVLAEKGHSEFECGEL